MSSLTCTIIQSSLHWHDKEANIRMFDEKIRSVDKTEVVILPEMFNTGFSMQPEVFAETMDGQTINWMRQLSAERKIIITGSLMIEEGGQYFNRLVWMLPNGQMGLYNKRHLFAYAGEDEHYAPGEKRLIASVKGWKINLQVCYDLRFPVWARQQTHAESEYHLLVYVANWPDRRRHAWKTLLQARAIENQCFVAGVNRVGVDGNNITYSGDSMVIDPLGEVKVHHENTENITTVTLEKSEVDDVRNRMPFWKDADPFMILQ